MKKYFKFLPTYLFLAFIFILTALFVTMPKSNYSSSEKRYLENFPETNISTITDGKFEESFETYLADHFPFRNAWVGINAYYNYGIGNNGSSGVYKCSDNYLINDPVSTDNRVEANGKAIADFSKSINNVPVTVTIAPSTGYIMNDVLPAVHDKYNDDEYFTTFTNQLKTGNNIKFVDLRQSFKQAEKNNTQLYYKTDHHWTTNGAYIAYTKLCESLGLKATDKSVYTVEKYKNFYGTTYSTSGYWLTPPDTIQVWNNKNNTEDNITVQIKEGTKTTTSHNLYFYSHLQEDDKYPVFLDGNHAIVNIKNTKVKSGRVLIVKDSFCHSLAPFLVDNYNLVTMVDMRYYKNSVSDMVKKGKYDQVLFVYGMDNIAEDSDLVWIK